MGVPFKGASKGVEDTDKARDKIFTFIHFVEEPHDDIANSLKKAVEQGAVFQEERAEFFVNRKNEMTMGTAEQFKRHFSGTIPAIFIAAGRTKLGMTTERDEYKITTMRATIHGAAIGRIPTIDHLLNAFHNNRARMEDILNFFKMFFKYFNLD